MTKIICPHQVKYKDRYIPANTAFEADDSDKKELVKMGGKTIDNRQLTVDNEKVKKSNSEGKNEAVGKVKNSDTK